MYQRCCKLRAELGFVAANSRQPDDCGVLLSVRLPNLFSTATAPKAYFGCLPAQGEELSHRGTWFVKQGFRVGYFNAFFVHDKE